MGNLIRNSILKSAKKIKHLSILVHETPDGSYNEQLTLVIRYIIEKLEIEELGIDPENVTVQCYYLAGNMSGIYKGVKVRMEENNPHVMYVLCYLH